MRIRLGYVAISKSIDETTSSTVTYTSYSSCSNKEEVLDKVIKSNLSALSILIDYNIKNNIHNVLLVFKDYIMMYEFCKILKNIF